MTPLRTALVAIALALAATACGSGAGDGPAPADVAATAPMGSDTTARPAAGPAEVPDVLDFTVAGVDGAQIAGADYAGRDVALWFWAPW